MKQHVVQASGQPEKEYNKNIKTNDPRDSLTNMYGCLVCKVGWSAPVDMLPTRDFFLLLIPIKLVAFDFVGECGVFVTSSKSETLRLVDRFTNPDPGLDSILRIVSIDCKQGAIPEV